MKSTHWTPFLKTMFCLWGGGGSTLIGLLQDTSVAACGGLQSRAQPLHVSLPLAGYLDRRSKHPPVSPPHPPLPSSKYKFYFTPPSTIRTTPSNLSCTSHEVDLPLPLAFFPVSSSHEAFFLKCAVLIKLIPLPPEAFFLCSPRTFRCLKQLMMTVVARHNKTAWLIMIVFTWKEKLPCWFKAHRP